ncbi:MAG: sensor histidine kinase, partial [Candidatus Ornithospirochaeta sp.]
VLPDCYFLVSRYKELGRKNTLILVSHLLLPTLCSVIDLWYKTNSMIPVTTLSVLLIYITINLQTVADTMEQKIELEKKDRELQEVRRHVMISQIQPHFIYNVLNIICILCRRDPKAAAKTTRTFARYLRMNVESLKKDHPVPFDEELLHAKTYLELEKVRFGDELDISYDIGPRNFCMPALSLQPMVENAVKHGLCMKEDGDGHLVISTREDGTNWYVIVSDDGVGYDTKKPKKNDGRSHIGVDNTKMRIEMMCHGSMETFSLPEKGTNVVITIPKLYDANCLPSDRVWEKEDEE